MFDIDRDEIIMSLTELAEQPTEDGVVDGVNQQTIKGALELLKEQETIVRCKDCKHRLECDYWIENGDDWFCADGEQKEDGETV